MAVKGKPSDEKLKQNLETVALAVSLPAFNALRAASIQFAALAYFMDHGQDLFRTNPANTLPHMALRALEEQSVLEFFENFKVTRHYSPIAVRVRELDVLEQHRDLIGHPATIQWKSEKRRQFAKDNRYSHFRCGVLWSIAKRLDEGLRAQGSEPRLATLPIDYHMAETLNLILRLSVKPEAVDIVPTSDKLLTYLESHRAGIIEILERFPDGTTSPDSGGEDETDTTR